MDAYDFVSKDLFRNSITGEEHFCGVSACQHKKRKESLWICTLTGVTLGDVENDNLDAMATKRTIKKAKMAQVVDIIEPCDSILYAIFCDEKTCINKSDVRFDEQELNNYSGLISKIYKWAGSPKDRITPFVIACLVVLSEGIETQNLVIVKDDKMEKWFDKVKVKEIGDIFVIRQKDITSMIKLLHNNPLGWLEIK